MIAVGDVVSVDGAQQAAYVFKINGRSGEIMWQRYYKDDHKVVARDILPHAHGKVGRSYSILLDTVDKETLETDEFARVLQVNERGRILDAKNVFHGRGAHAMGMFLGYNDERIVVGAADVQAMDDAMMDKMDKMDDGAKMMDKEMVMKSSKDGLVLAVPAASFYADPCLPPTDQ